MTKICIVKTKYIKDGIEHTLCGRKEEFATLIDEHGKWLGDFHPTCEACILLHFTNPNKTKRL